MMANSDSSMVTDYLLLKNHYNTKTSKKVIKITPHHAAGMTTVKGMYNTFSTRQASANYGLAKGKVALYVHEKDRAWTSSNSQDNYAITIEIGNSTGAPYWKVADVDVKNLILLCVDICKRNGMPGLTWTGDSKGTLTFHYMFKATACPGPYIKALAPWIASEVTARVNGKTGDIVIPTVVDCTNGTCVLASQINNTKTEQKTETKAETNDTATYIYQGVDLTPVFNASYYADKYSDLRFAFGDDKKALFNHFCQCGMREARQGSSTFNVASYRSNYPDLNDAFGDNWVKYYAHYCIQGVKEGRKGI